PCLATRSTCSTPGIFTFAAHGNDQIVQNNKLIPYVQWSAPETMQQLRARGLARGQDVFSLSCGFGQQGSFGPVQAQFVADRNASKVYGADCFVLHNRKDRITALTVHSGRNGEGEQGAFQLFEPGGNGVPVEGASIREI